VEFKIYPHPVTRLKKEWSSTSNPALCFNGLFCGELHFKCTLQAPYYLLHFVADEPLSSTGFNRWSPGQPDNYGGNATHPGEDCGSMHTNGGLNDMGCDLQFPFMCEQELW
jgi:hypothetical protein